MNPILRSAQSTPVINEKENSNECLSVRRPDSVQFNAGCSSSSTDLSQLLEIYNDVGENAGFDEWLIQYKKQHNMLDEKNGSGTISIEGYEGKLLKLLNQSIRDQASNYIGAINNMHRSMDVLPIIKEGFFALEKCVSTDFAPKNYAPPSKLCRSKEMPNILDEDGYE
ncbi:hypothetical protein M3Y97_00566200 [Aphelenchoides bicaudatus]|nr:hypothetical protein M3Y97_00566200 [Aphelenchoides bicaudatus]